MSTIKNILTQLAHLLVSSDTLWRALSKSMIRASQFLCAARNSHEVEVIVARNPSLKQALSAKTVLHGPFHGMVYGNTKAFCSALYPKLLGSYEHELAEVVAQAMTGQYPLFVDVGAADGYYAVGFARQQPAARVIAFEQDARARQELQKLAALNGVASRVCIEQRCEPADLLALSAARGLLLADCEGYEEHLLNPEVIAHLKEWDFLIETHDGYAPGITRRLEAAFRDTHRVSVIEVVHDLNKADHFTAPELTGLSRHEQDLLLAERRQHACMRWLVCHASRMA